ncbi:Triosephosphate isomerase [Clostridium thermopalmarium DSM 5974]|uniref:Triosephosphate isomerase n=3 Tax=Clostridiaceae TaxID=31979 RepID=A0A151AN70_9CLOT|nr:triosephosphate isomerase [Clostridium colicanis DSM 13634]PRR74399.1 Triosephosphate isomerase [Clostridium thermopalmarium DSM 5974]PVZ21654.1 triosephosphate isomerase [Clostridium thermopalmarium DSM 5974]
MNNTVSQALKLIEELKPLVKDANCEVVVCPPTICLDAVVKAVKGTNIEVGAQNMHFEESGAFTGETSPAMLEEMGVKYVILGHSERRQYFAENDADLNKKIKKAFEHNLIPILCIGETLEEREANITEEVLARQIKLDLAGLEKEQVEKLVIAYEPIWAIGTGKTATADQAEETIAFVRKTVAGMFGEETAEKMRIQYGGSVKPSTIKEQMAKPNIDGGLIGGASLKAEDFAAIVNFDK